jgi:retinol dehydrogenase-12
MEWVMTMQGKTVLVTGATDGIGKVTARGLLELGASLLILGRHAEKTARVADELAAATGRPRPLTFIADLSQPKQVKRVAGEILGRLAILDILINNAGAFFAKREQNVEGMEMTFALNHLNYFLLTHHLLPLLKKSPQGRIVNVASEAHRGVALDFGNLQGEQSYHGWRAYQRSKLANILFTAELAERLQGTKVTTNSLHPGFVASNFGHNNRGWLANIFKISQKLFAINEEKGAQTSIHVASAPELAQTTGLYFSDRRAKVPSSAAQDRQARKKLWDVSEKILSPYL